MSTHTAEDGCSSPVSLPDAVPLDLARVTRISWELGDRIVTDEETTHHATWAVTDTARKVAIFRATSETDLVRVTTPAGRDRFYGAVSSDIEAAIPDLEAAHDWDRVD